MKNDKTKLEQRLHNMKTFYGKVGEVIDAIPDAIPGNVKSMLKDKILGDNDLKKLMNDIDADMRPPKFFLIGRTGVGKSSLINAMCKTYVSTVSDTKACTKNAQIYKCKNDERVLMEILDTRGIAESESLDSKISAEDEIIKKLEAFSPDAAIFMLNCTHRDGVKDDVLFVKKISQTYEKTNKVKLPIIVVVNKCDEMAPSRHKNPSDYPKSKVEKIIEQVSYFRKIIMDNDLKVESIIPVASLIDWQTSDGEEISVADINKLPKQDRDNLEIAFDGRYNIEELLDILEKAILDYEAQLGLRMALKLQDVVKKCAKYLNNIFSGIAAAVATTPIPISDIYILLIIQAVLVVLIAALSGRDISLEAAKEFIFSLGGIAGAGYTFKLLAQQAAKLMNGLWPAAGSLVSSGIAASGTSAIGNAAIAYYLDDTKMAEAKKGFEKLRDEKIAEEEFFDEE